MKTAFYSYAHGPLPKGCTQCVRGKKLVLFLGGTCGRSCWYCSLSNSRSKGRQVMANERPVMKIQDLIDEVHASKAKGAGITGGDPLEFYEELLIYTKALKETFGPTFHIHIYLPLHLVTRERLNELEPYIDEVRLHPSLFVTLNEEVLRKEKEQIREVALIFGRERVGIELPLVPGKRDLVYSYLLEVSDSISFMNLNELEISETNEQLFAKRFAFNEDTYTVRGSVTDGKWIVEKAKKEGLGVSIHFCTAKTKDSAQYKNRLKQYDTLPYGNKTGEGTVVYFCIYTKNLEKDVRILREITKNYYEDKENERIIVRMADVEAVYDDGRFTITRVEECPTYGQETITKSVIGE